MMSVTSPTQPIVQGVSEHMRNDLRLGGVHAYHYSSATEPPDYSLLIVHGLGGHGGTYDVFCQPMASRGVDVYSMDLPGHGLGRNPRGNFRFIEWLEDIDEAARTIKEISSAPLFVLGSSQGSAAAFHSLAYSDSVDGAVTMGIILNEVPVDRDCGLGRIRAKFVGPDATRIATGEGDERRIDLRTAIDWDNDYAREDSNVLEKKLADPLRTWSYGFASLHSYWAYQPPIAPSENRKPVLVSAGAEDPLMPSTYIEDCFAEIGGPKELYLMPDAGHQLMTYYTGDYVEVVDGWIKRQLKNFDSASTPAHNV